MTWTAQSLSEFATGYWSAATLMAAVELGLFDAIEFGPATMEVVAERTRSQPDRLTALLDALAAVGLLIKSAAGYDFAAGVRPLLVRSSPTCLLDALAYNGSLYRQWANLAAVVRGEMPSTGHAQLGGDPAATRRFVLGMDAKARAFAPGIADKLDLGGIKTLLDIGAGPGTLSRLLAERSSELHVTLLDLPEVLAVAKDVCAASAIAHRLAFHPADYRQDALPRPFDAVLFAGALHQETPVSAATLFVEVRRALRTGGRFYVVDLMLGHTRTAPTFSALFQLNMLLLRPGSWVFSIDETRAALDAAGIEPGRYVVVPETPYVLVEGTAR